MMMYLIAIPRRSSEFRVAAQPPSGLPAPGASGGGPREQAAAGGRLLAGVSGG
ncbi:hypothetical protein KCH_25830 [Kitasatospora cheerisanensis KCTC 2395]|uniref:Uncharacterized protein n=1 Tax=Kitasatospora cheerisanensis KCTC 2395 TaxID=1348663 RepID=A0A066Z0D4_9ACTN|nr:hypothetical protein KCH_25830 [Kitasatospora cheerisanensis KCTC 2395]